MGDRTMNVGEGLAMIGIFFAVAMLNNYWLLLFLFIPIWSWQKVKTDDNNEYVKCLRKLKIQKLEQEIRLLKARKR